MGKKQKTTEQKQDLGLRIVGIILAVLFLLGIGYAIIQNTGVVQRSAVAVSTEHYKVDNAMLNYFYHVAYNNFTNNYYSYISYFFDTSKSLKTQASSFGDGTWFDYFLDAAVSSAKNVCVLCEEAREQGIKLDDADKDKLAENIKAIKDAAKNNNVSVDTYVAAMYGTGVKLGDVKKCVEMSLLASKVYDKQYDSYSFTEEDYNKYAEDNKSAVYVADYASYTVKADIPDEATDEEKKTARDTAKAKADELATLTTKEAFLAKVKELVNDDDKFDEEDYLSKNAAWGETSDLEKWAFGADTKVGDTKVIAADDENSYTAYLLLTTSHLNESRTVNVRHILISADSKAEDAVKQIAKEKADEILAEYNKGEKTAEAFGKLAKQYTEDSNGDEGGLYENVTEGQMVTEFNDWIFDEARKEGDTGIVQTSYGYHVMYFAGEGMIQWKLTADNGLRSDKYNEDYKALETKYAVKADMNKAAKIDVA